ncbi:MAG TPA: ABC transporter permease, partial [Gemmatimonadaceae bacterium]|nr:ABC transporter permease [Gemmatimonadaceae bacterium]
MLLVIFAYGISWDVNDIKTAVVDQDRTAASRALVDAFRSSGYFTIRESLTRSADVDALIDRGRVQLALVIPTDFSSDLDAGRPAQVQAIVDGSDANTATIALGYTQAVVRSYGAGAGGIAAAPSSPIRL